MDKIKAKMYLTKELIKQAAESKPDIDGRMLCTFSPDYDMISVKTNDEDSVGYKLTIYIRETGVTWSCLIGPEKEPIKRIKSTVLYQYDPDDERMVLRDKVIKKAEDIITKTVDIYKGEVEKKILESR